jgi:autoinducer 2-degrading protein
MAPIAYTVTLRAVPGRREELVAALTELVEAAQDEPGTLVYAFHEDESDPDVVWSYELFAGDDALAAHRDTPLVSAVSGRLRALLAEPAHARRGPPAVGKGLPLPPL